MNTHKFLLMIMLCFLSVAAIAGHPTQSSKVHHSVLLKHAPAKRQIDQQLIDAIRKDVVPHALLLIKRGANVNQRVIDYIDDKTKKDIYEFHKDLHLDQQPGTPPTLLMFAVVHGQNEIVQALLHAGAAVNVRGDYYLEDRHDFDAVYYDGLDDATALHLAVHLRNQTIIECLLWAHAELEARDSRGYTPLLIAVYEHNFAVVKQLISAKCKVNISGKDHLTPLEFAADRGDEELYDCLKKAGVKGNFEIGDGKVQADFVTTPLHPKRPIDHQLIDAIRKNDIPLALRSIDNGAYVNQRVTDYIEIELKEQFHSFPKLYADSVKYIKAPTVLMFAVAYGQKEIVMALIRNGAPVSAKGDYYLEDGRDYDAIYHSWFNRSTALHLAVQRANIAIISNLIHAGAAVDAEDEEGYTPILIVVHYRNLVVVKRLIRAKCNVNVIGKDHNTPLSLAADNGDRDIYKCLKRAGARGNYELRDNNVPVGIPPGGVE